MKKKLSFLVIIIILAGSLFQNCSKANEVKGNDDDKFIISGAGEAIGITVKDLIKNFKPVNADVISISSSGEENKMNIEGVSLKDVLSSKGIEITSYNSIRAVAGDGYSIEIPQEVLSQRNIILAYKMNGDFLKDKSRPIRVVIPNERAMYWARNVVEIVLLKEKNTVETGKIVFLETAYKLIPQTKYMYQDSYDMVVPVKDLLSAYCPDCESDLNFVCRDSLKKSETKENALLSFIKISGKGSPLFLSPDLPGGMFVKNIHFFKQNNVCFYSLEKNISIAEIMKNTGLLNSENYLITDLKGNKTKLKRDIISNGIIYFENDVYSVLFTGDGNIIKEILSIETTD